MLTFWENLPGRARPVSRRAVLQVGALGWGGLNLADLWRARAGASPTTGQAPPTSVIHVFLGGGPSHLDTFDMKPGAPTEIRGEFGPIATRQPGVVVCEHLPHLAGVLDRLAIVRSVAHGDASHLPASHWMVTGHQPPPATTSNVNPYCGAVAARLRGANLPGMPAYVSIPRRQLLGAAAYLGPAYNPLTTDSDPNADDFAVKNLCSPAGIDANRLADRAGLRRDLDRLRAGLDRHGQAGGLDQFSSAAFELVSASHVQQAFAIERETPAVRERYGRTSAGQRCLLARRLVEAGATFVTVLAGGEWDTHVDNFTTLKNTSLPPVDRALAALVCEIQERGLDRQVLLLVSGEFGRTPTINARAGRDHWPGAFSVLFAGGGMRMGQVIGATDQRGLRPVTHPYSPGDVLATIYHFLEIDTTHVFHDPLGRPVPVLPEGAPIAALWG